jgi:hypothetical protein
MHVAPLIACTSASPTDRNESPHLHSHLLAIDCSSWPRSTNPDDGPTIALNQINRLDPSEG